MVDMFVDIVFFWFVALVKKFVFLVGELYFLWIKILLLVISLLFSLQIVESFFYYY